MAQIKLYASPLCPWAQRAWIALLETRTPFSYETISLGPDKPQSFVDLYRSIVPDPEAAAKVPVLVDGETKLTESAVVAEYVAAKYSDKAQLIPADPAQAAKAKLWAEVFASQVFAPVWLMLGADTREGLAAGQRKLEHGLKVADSFLQVHGSAGGGPFLLGSYSLGEVLTTSLAQRTLMFTKAFRGTDVWQLIKEQRLDRLERWMRATLDRPTAQQTAPPEEKAVQFMKGRVKDIKD